MGKQPGFYTVMIKTGPKMGTNVPELLPTEARAQAADPEQQGQGAMSAGSRVESLAAGRKNERPGREERRETSKEFKLQFLERHLQLEVMGVMLFQLGAAH